MKAQKRCRGHTIHLSVISCKSKPMALERLRECPAQDKGKKLRHIVLAGGAGPPPQASFPRLLPQEVDVPVPQDKAQGRGKGPPKDVGAPSPKQGPCKADGSGVDVAVVGGVFKLGHRGKVWRQVAPRLMRPSWIFRGQ